MSFFNSLFGGGGVSPQVGQAFASGITGIGSAIAAAGVAKEQAKNHRLIAEINSKRVARQVRYQQGLAAVQNAGAGNGQQGSYLFVAADNARQGMEKIQDEIVKGEQAVAQDKARTPSVAAAGVNFVGSLAGAIAQQNASNYKAG